MNLKGLVAIPVEKVLGGQTYLVRDKEGNLFVGNVKLRGRDTIEFWKLSLHGNNSIRSERMEEIAIFRPTIDQAYGVIVQILAEADNAIEIAKQEAVAAIQLVPQTVEVEPGPTDIEAQLGLSLAQLGYEIAQINALKLLMLSPQTVITHDQIWTAWGRVGDHNPDKVSGFMARIRERFPPDRGEIKTHIRKGYSFLPASNGNGTH
jgi:hypothetical protein